MKRIIILVTLAIIGFSANAQWQQTSLDSGSISCFAISGNKIFAGHDDGIGYGAGVYFSANGGSSWSSAGLTDTNVWSLAIKGDTVFAGEMFDGGTYKGGIFYSADNGSHWIESINALVGSNVVAIVVSGNNIFAGTNGDGVFLSSNNGSSWAAVNSGLDDKMVYALAIKGDTILAGTDSVYFSVNNGSSWSYANTGLPPEGIDEFAVSGSNIFAGNNSYGTGMYISTNNGNSWSAINNGFSGSAIYITAIAISGDSVFAGTEDGVYLTLDSGQLWTPVNNGLPDNTLIWSLDIKGDTLFAGTGGNGVWRCPLSELTGIKEVDNTLGNIAVYPNPSVNNLTIESPQGSIIEITNMQGQLIKSIANTFNKTNVDVSAFPSGVYIVEVKTQNGVGVKKFVKE